MNKMEWLFVIFMSVVLLSLLYQWNQRNVRKRREKLIDTYRFPASIGDKVNEKYPHLKPKDLQLVISTLREYFHICNLAGTKVVSMPSQVVDIAWHEFILFTKEYEHFCKKALGRFLHHTPAEAMEKPTSAQKGIKRAWRLSCLREGIDNQAAKALPMLFAIDALLQIEDGFKYSLDCTKSDKHEYCTSHIGCSSAGSSSSEGGSDGGGCGGGCGSS